MKRILFFAPSINRGRWHPLVDEFAKTNDVQYFTPRGFWRGSGQGEITSLMDATVSKHGALEFPLGRKIAKIIKDFKPDLIHNFGEPAYPVSYLAAVHAGDAVMSCKFSQNIYQKWPRYFERREAFVLNRANVIHAPAEQSRAIAHQKDPNANVEIVPWGASDIFEAPAIQTKRDQILFVGKLIERKGWRTLLNALEAVDLPPEAEVLMVGSGPDTDEAKTMIANGRYAGRIKLMGQVPHAELCKLYQSARMVIMPSKHSDGSDWGHGKKYKFMRVKWDEQFGMVAAEAMLAGAPVVHSDNGSLPEVVGYSDLCFKQGDPVSLAAVMNAVLAKTDSEHDAISDAMIAHAQSYRWENVANRMIDLWNQQ
ncbi:glycosyltransferase [Octadecabacter sp. G9-8]|uniref:Glycosyltransferase n=1 Tax=Octadecabacter dasysiphoniae TaxID=2909341 RepID=A0ABS9CQF7_9RHOB|nr:glycosyltransferase [Octadecabacter dasysiphoniae]MCF2869457.1 glycosyltransferase [Octadecabacter dasysiphoniae]